MKTLVRPFIFILVIFLSCKDDKINLIPKLSTSEIKNNTAFTAMEWRQY